jgi:hypothetical protein
VDTAKSSDSQRALCFGAVQVQFSDQVRPEVDFLVQSSRPIEVFPGSGEQTGRDPSLPRSLVPQDFGINPAQIQRHYDMLVNRRPGIPERITVAKSQRRAKPPGWLAFDSARVLRLAIAIVAVLLAFLATAPAVTSLKLWWKAETLIPARRVISSAVSGLAYSAWMYVSARAIEQNQANLLEKRPFPSPGRRPLMNVEERDAEAS